MNLLPSETILKESSGKSLTLTTHRIRFQTETFGSAQVQSIMLEEIASCALVKTSQPLLLVLAGLCFLIGWIAVDSARDGGGVFILCLFIAGVLVLAYFVSQKQVIAFASAGTTIRVNTKGMKLEDAKSFIDHAETAKNARYLLLAR